MRTINVNWNRIAAVMLIIGLAATVGWLVILHNDLASVHDDLAALRADLADAETSLATALVMAGTELNAIETSVSDIYNPSPLVSTGLAADLRAIKEDVQFIRYNGLP